MKSIFLIIFSLILISSCAKEDGSDGGSFDSGFNSMDAVISATSPSGFTGTKSNKGMCTYSATPTASEVITCASNIIFSTGGNDMTYYRKWPKEVDTRISNLESRFEEIPSCFTSSPQAIALNFSIGSASVNESFFLNCWENHSTPSGYTQDMGVGFNGNFAYVVIRTSMPQGSRLVLIGKMDKSTNEVTAHVLSYRDDSGTANDDGVAYKIVANKNTDSFYFNYAAANINNNDFCHISVHSNGTDAFTDVEAARVSCHATTIGSANCIQSNNPNSDGSDCSSINGGAQFGSANVQMSTMKSIVDNIFNINYNNEGVGTLN